SALSRKVRRASKRPLPLLSSSILSSFSLECEKRSAERSESRGEAFGRMLRLLSDRCHPARKNPPRRMLGLWIGLAPRVAFRAFAFGKTFTVKTTLFASKKECCSVLDFYGQILFMQKVEF
ncbi:MAG: hypothetical protein IKL01_03705, partial [Mailhella sp.]|nr:hypothetical protein [Mailhella sp.]